MSSIDVQNWSGFTNVLHDIEAEIGRITHFVQHKDKRLSIWEIRSLNRIKDQIDDLLLINKKG